jgi:hypothetical protein
MSYNRTKEKAFFAFRALPRFLRCGDLYRTPWESSFDLLQMPVPGMFRVDEAGLTYMLYIFYI